MLPGAQTQRASYYIAQKGKYQTFDVCISSNRVSDSPPWGGGMGTPYIKIVYSGFDRLGSPSMY